MSSSVGDWRALEGLDTLDVSFKMHRIKGIKQRLHSNWDGLWHYAMEIDMHSY